MKIETIPSDETLKLIEKIKMWCEEGRAKRYGRYSRTMEEFTVDLCYFIATNQIRILEMLDKISKSLLEK